MGFRIYDLLEKETNYEHSGVAIYKGLDQKLLINEALAHDNSIVNYYLGERDGWITPKVFILIRTVLADVKGISTNGYCHLTIKKAHVSSTQGNEQVQVPSLEQATNGGSEVIFLSLICVIFIRKDLLLFILFA